MKRLAFLASLLFSVSLLAQEGPVISSAIIAIDRNNDLPEAKKYIDKADEIISAKPEGEVREKDMSKFYYYKGLINYRIHQSDKEEIQALEDNALDKALDGFTNLLAYEEKVDRERYSDEARDQLLFVVNDLARRAIGKSQEQDFKGAYDDFLYVYELKKQPPIETMDTTMLYNAAVMAQNAKMYDKALDINQQLLDLGYKGVTYSATNVETGETTVFPNKRTMDLSVKKGAYKDPKAEGDITSDLYVTIAGLAIQTGDTARYEKMVTEGRKKFPQNEALLRSELRILLETEQYDKALKNLDQAVQTAEGQDKVVMYYNKGVILQTEMERTNEALVAYKNALELDSNYSDALYMSSIIYIDSANAIGKRMNDLPLSATTKYKKMEKEQKSVFEEALPYLERAYKTNPEDPQVMTALSQVYRALRMNEKFMEMQEKIKAMPKAEE